LSARARTRAHIAGPDRVERVGLAARAALPPQPADLEHPLATAGEEARETGAERACPLDSEHTTPRRLLLAERERLPVAIAVCRNVRLEHDRAASNLDDRERMRVAMRVDTNDGAQPICRHPSTASHALGDTSGVGLGWRTAGGRTVTGHALTTRTGF
jgi:hypothetical protein